MPIHAKIYKSPNLPQIFFLPEYHLTMFEKSSLNWVPDLIEAGDDPVQNPEVFIEIIQILEPKTAFNK